MSNTFVVDDESLITRKYVQDIFDTLIEHGHDTIDLQNVEFVSRASGDEIVHQSNIHNIKIINQTTEVKKMLEVIN